MGCTFVGIILILTGVLAGYFRGVWRCLAAFAAFAVAGLLARPFAFLTSWIISLISAVPLTLKPVASILATGILIFGVATWAIDRRYISPREKLRKEAGLQPMTLGEAYGGSAVGGVWGFCLVILILTGIEAVGSLDYAMRQAMGQANQVQAVVASRTSSPASSYGSPSQEGATPLPPHSPAEGAGAAGANGSAALPGTNPPPASAPTASDTPTPGVIPVDDTGPLAQMRREISQSVFAPVVQKVNPVDEHVKGLLRKLTIVVGNADLYMRFQQHPAIARFTSDPKLVALSQDAEVASLIQAQDYQKLLDNPKLAEMLNDSELTGRLKGLKLDAVLDDVMRGP